VETKSALEGAPNELSFYATESYWTGKSSELRRYTLRLDGFVSIHAPMKGGELITKPFTFTGKATHDELRQLRRRWNRSRNPRRHQTGNCSHD
jgi:hypothetical protein